MAGTSPNETGSEPRSRAIKHVTRACIGCQRRKTKCDGVKPQCTTCSLYKQECTFSQEIDRRRMASKGKISLLVAYVQDLESLLLRHHIPLPPSRPKHFLPAVSTSSPVNDVEPMLDVPTQNADDRTATTVEHGISMVSNQNTPETHDQLSISGESSYMSPLSDRMGSLQIAEDGQLRFFGLTSNLHISHVGPFPLFNSNIRSVHWNEALILKAAGVGHEVEEELEDHLTKLYFTWENPNIPLVDEATYYQEKDRYRRLNQPSHRYSEVLNNAM